MSVEEIREIDNRINMKCYAGCGRCPVKKSNEVWVGSRFFMYVQKDLNGFAPWSLPPEMWHFKRVDFFALSR